MIGRNGGAKRKVYIGLILVYIERRMRLEKLAGGLHEVTKGLHGDERGQKRRIEEVREGK